MNNRERYKQAFSVLHASERTEEEVRTIRMPRYSVMRRATAAALCLVLFMGTGAAVHAYGGQIVRQVFGWGNNMKITDETDPDTGENRHEVTVMTESLTRPIETEGGKIYFVVNGEHIDITDRMSETEAYTYEYTDEDGLTHYWLVGVNDAEKGEYGFGEYIKDPDGEWIGGYSAWTNLDENGNGPEWLESGKEKLDCPW